jgi:hypothetical protein
LRKAGRREREGDRLPRRFPLSAECSDNTNARTEVSINDAANGVFLPGNLAAENAAGAAVHSTTHTRSTTAR